MPTPTTLVLLEPANTTLVILEPNEDGDDIVTIEGDDNVSLTIAEVMTGLPGPTGTVEDYIHTQSSAATDWTVNHNLGRRPEVTVLSPGGVVVFAGITHISDNQLIVQFATAQTGTVRCL